jgi:DNA-binding response OmpR family regulator
MRETVDVLIVEDEREIAELICESLQPLGMQCRIAADAGAADQALSEGRFDAVTLDLGIPGRSGVEWLEIVAERQPELARRTLVITGVELERDLVERLARCGAGILAKPFSLAGLHQAVRSQFARPIHLTALCN